MSGAGNGSTVPCETESVINHLDSRTQAPGMLRKDNSPIFGRSNIVNRGSLYDLSVFVTM